MGYSYAHLYLIEIALAIYLKINLNKHLFINVKFEISLLNILNFTDLIKIKFELPWFI